ncbi:MAG: prolyl oligopeptidase family serine peptidase, partial [Kofleriaceae bacterium]
KIPMFVVHRKGLVLDGTNPTYLTGYGASAEASSPAFLPIEAEWIASGGVLATAVIRGGNEYGEAWQKAAEKTHRQVAFDDFIAAAEWLIAQKITSPAKLAISGASNGGLLVATVALQRPELFGAVVVKVGVLDMLRFHLAGQGAGWQSVYAAVRRGECRPRRFDDARRTRDERVRRARVRASGTALTAVPPSTSLACAEAMPQEDPWTEPTCDERCRLAARARLSAGGHPRDARRGARQVPRRLSR